MARPGVTIEIQNGQLGQTAGTADNVVGMVTSGLTHNGITIGESYRVFSLSEAEGLGVTSLAHPDVYPRIKRFYDEAGEGAELWFMVVSDATLMASVCDLNNDFARKLQYDSGGRIRVMAISRLPVGYAPDFTGFGIDPDVKDAAEKAHALGEQLASEFMPCRFIIEGRDYQGNSADLFDFSTTNYNRASVVISRVSSNGSTAHPEVLLGRIAKIPVHRNPGRVKDGALSIDAGYLSDGSKIDTVDSATLDAIHDKGYILFSKYLGVDGYFVSDDPTCTIASDDFNSLARGRVIDKALILVYQTYVQEILDDVQVDDDGRISAGVIKSYQSGISNVLEQEMFEADELSTAPEVVIDPNQDILASNKLEVSISLVPKGYNKAIVIQLGFSNPNN